MNTQPAPPTPITSEPALIPPHWFWCGFLPYQLDWLTNPSRFKIGLWARQTGKDYTCAAEAVFDCLQRPLTNWLILGAGERQAIETMEKAKDWAAELVGNENFQFEIRDFPADELASSDKKSAAKSRRASSPKFTGGKITFPNGSRILALPANAHTIRGYSANLLLTEFAFHEQGDEIWRAIYPSISNPLRGGLKKVRIISTPNGLNNKFAQLWHSADHLWYKSRVTIHDAFAQGLPVNIDEIRDGLNDPHAWEQEYECQFVDTSSVLLPFDLIHPCESSETTEHSSPLELSKLSGQLFAGIDFGRKNHLTVCWLFERKFSPAHSRPLLFTREVLVLRDLSTPDQIAALRPRLHRVARVSLDYTGAGIGLGDYLVKHFHEYNLQKHRYGKVELCQFTSALKAELFPRLRVAFENKDLLIPINPDIRADLHGVQRLVSSTGQVSYRALSKADGHSDRCTALALALRAASTIPASHPPAAPRRYSPPILHPIRARRILW